MARRRSQSDIQIVARPSDAQIADLAYLIWCYENHPEGRQMEHWLAAERTLQSEAAERAAALPSHNGKTRKRGRRST
jgi:hypothetical protein